MFVLRRDAWNAEIVASYLNGQLEPDSESEPDVSGKDSRFDSG